MSVRSALVTGAAVLAVSGACVAGLLFYGQALSDATVAEGTLKTPQEIAAALEAARQRFGAMSPAAHLAAARAALTNGYDPRSGTGGDVHGAEMHLGAIPPDAPEQAEAGALRVEMAWRRSAGRREAPAGTYPRLRDTADVLPARVTADGPQPPCLRGTSGASTWQMQRASGPVCFGRTFTRHGESGEYAQAAIPAADDVAWRGVASPIIEFVEASALCATACRCLDGGMFTYFQSSFVLPAGQRASTLTVTVGGADDGARVTVNGRERLPTARDPGSFIALGGVGATGDLGAFVVAGTNRVVVTHLDDCCSDSGLLGVRVALDGVVLRACRAAGG